MLVERLGRDAVRKALHHERPVGDRGQDVRRGLHVVAEQIALGELLLRPEHLVQVGDREPLAAGQFERAVAPGVFERVQLIDERVERGPAATSRRSGAGARRRGAWTFDCVPPPRGRRVSGCSRTCPPFSSRTHLARILVVPQPEIHRMPQLRVGGPLGEPDLRDELAARTQCGRSLVCGRMA